MRTPFPLRAALALSLLACPGALRAEEGTEAAPDRFRLFPDEPTPAPRPPVPPAAKKPEKRFWAAAGEVAAVEVLPWLHNHYLKDEGFSRVSWGTVRDNLRAGLSFDDDKFTTNQLGHPLHGSLFFNASRSNGLSFWASVPSVVVGSYVWEIAGENQKPSFNDFVNSSLGGPVVGEVSHRLSRMLLDSTARGSGRVLRELGAGLLDPVQFFTRLFTGDLWRVQANPDDRFPGRFVAVLDPGYRHLSASSPGADQFLLASTFRYGDPFAGDVRTPFASFEAALDITTPSSVWLTRTEMRGLLRAWEVGAPDRSRHLLGAFLDFDYQNGDQRVFGSQSVRFGLLSLRPLGRFAELRAEALLAGAPLAALRTDHPTAGNLTVGRNYDYGPGAGIYTAVRARRDEVDLVTLSYSCFWMHTSNGVARSSAIQSFRAEGRIPFSRMIALGGSWGWGRRVTSYDDFATVNVTVSQGRVFAALTWR